MTDITNDADVTEAIHYFSAGGDDGTMSSASSIFSGRSFSSRKVTLRVNITVDYDGPSLSDTSSMVSLDEYRRSSAPNGHSSRRSDISFSLNGSQGPLDDDAVTVSSRDHRSLAQPAVTRHTAEGSISLGSLGSDWDEETSYVSRSSSSLAHVARQADPFTDRRAPSSHGVFDRLRREQLPPAIDSFGAVRADSEDDPRTAWLRDQSSRTIQALIGGPPAPSDFDAQSFSLNGGSEAPASEADPMGDGLALERAPSGKYYYTYTSSAASQAREPVESLSGIDSVNDSSFLYMSPQHTGASGSGSNAVPRPGLATSSSDPVTVREQWEKYDHLAPEVVQFLGPPAEELTDCSSCGSVLDMMRYVCATCGPKAPREATPKVDPEDACDTASGKGKERRCAHPPPTHRTGSGSSTGSASSKGSGGRVIEHNADISMLGLFRARLDLSMRFGPQEPSPKHVPVPALSPPPPAHSPSSSPASTFYVPPGVRRAGSGSASGSGSMTAYSEGYELCASCIESVGVVHALDAGLTGSNGSGSSFVSHSPVTSNSPTATYSPVVNQTNPGRPSSPEEAMRTLSQWRRAAPRTKGQLRHAYIEKVWGTKGWENVGMLISL